MVGPLLTARSLSSSGDDIGDPLPCLSAARWSVEMRVPAPRDCARWLVGVGVLVVGFGLPLGGGPLARAKCRAARDMEMPLADLGDMFGIGCADAGVEGLAAPASPPLTLPLALCAW